MHQTHVIITLVLEQVRGWFLGHFQGLLSVEGIWYRCNLQRIVFEAETEDWNHSEQAASKMKENQKVPHSFDHNFGSRTS